MKIFKLLKDIRYKIACLEDRLYGIRDGFKIVSEKEFLPLFGCPPFRVVIPIFRFSDIDFYVVDDRNLIAGYVFFVNEKFYHFVKKEKGDRSVTLEQFKVEEELEENWHKKHPVLGYFIDLYNYFVYRLPDKIDMFPRRIYWFIQRGKKGYADIDVWNLYNYLARVISGGTKQLREGLHGYPVDLTSKKWKKILKQISEGFELVQNDSFGLTSVKEYKKNEKYYKKMRRKNKKYYPTKTDVKRVEKAFDLFQKYFASLWD